MKRNIAKKKNNKGSNSQNKEDIQGLKSEVDLNSKDINDNKEINKNFNQSSEEKKHNKRNSKTNENINDKEKNLGFFKKVWWSITKIEKYPELAADGFWRAISYLLIFSIILAISTSCRTIEYTKKEIKTSIENLSFDFSYKDGVLNVSSDEQPIKLENEELGRIIIDTKTEDENAINEYKNSIENKQEAVVILKDKIMYAKISYESGNIQNPNVSVEEKSYTDLKNKYQLDLDEFNKQELLDYLSSEKMQNVYFNYFSTMTVTGFVLVLLNLFTYVILISFFGYATVWMLRMKKRYVAIFNMTIYAITLPTIIDIVYQLINVFVDFRIQYFDSMFVLLTAIYLFAAIFMIKADDDKKQGELQKIEDEEKKVKKEAKEKVIDNPDKKDDKKKNSGEEKDNNNGRKDGKDKDNNGGEKDGKETNNEDNKKTGSIDENETHNGKNKKKGNAEGKDTVGGKEDTPVEGSEA